MEIDSAGVEIVLVSGVSASELVPVKGLAELMVERLLVELLARRESDVEFGLILISSSRALEGITTP